MEFQDIIYQKKDGVATITINRPHVYNAFRNQTIQEMVQALEDADEDGTAGVVVIRGAGDKAFCTGGDVQALLGKAGGENMRAFGKKFGRIGTIIREMAKPVIAAVDGWCIGGGNELNCWCDLTLATDRSRFGQRGAMVGGCPVYLTQLLPRLVGDKKAKEIIFLCQDYSAEEAMKMGLVNQVVPAARFEEELEKLCQRLLDMSPTSIRIAKEAVNFGQALQDSHMALAGDLLGYYFGSPEQQEGPRAFREKRKPDFRQFRK